LFKLASLSHILTLLSYTEILQEYTLKAHPLEEIGGKKFFDRPSFFSVFRFSVKMLSFTLIAPISQLQARQSIASRKLRLVLLKIDEKNPASLADLNNTTIYRLTRGSGLVFLAHAVDRRHVLCCCCTPGTGNTKLGLDILRDVRGPCSVRAKPIKCVLLKKRHVRGRTHAVYVGLHRGQRSKPLI